MTDPRDREIERLDREIEHLERESERDGITEAERRAIYREINEIRRDFFAEEERWQDEGRDRGWL